MTRIGNRETRKRSASAASISGVLACLALAGCAGVSVAPSAHAPESVSMASAAGIAVYADANAAQDLTRAVDERFAIMRDVAAAKWMSGAPIRDAAREEVVLQQVAARATAVGLEPVATRAFFDEQIRLARELQQRWHEAWKTQGRCPPCEEPAGLQAVRERIDAANEQQLGALYLLVPLGGAVRASVAAEVDKLAPRYGLTRSDADALTASVAAITRTAGGPTLERIRATKVLRIATTGDYAPFSLETDGHLSGADIELGRSLARHLGVEPVFLRTSWPTLLDDLRNGRFDVALSGISFTADRAELGLYSAAYHEGGKTILARCADRERFDTVAEVDRPGVRVIVNPGGTNERYVREHIRAATIIVHPDNRTVFDEIVAGRADLMVTDDVEAELQSRRRPALCQTYPGTLTHGEKRILMMPDPALQAAVDAWMAAAMAAGEPARELERAMRAYASGKTPAE
jgi:cyclohexadienyl dehydratase